VLVLDDYHLISAASIHDALTALLTHAPPRLHSVVASRADPPLPLARLRAGTELTEVRAADPRFIPEETRAFLIGAMGLDLPTDAIAALEARTEAGLSRSNSPRSRCGDARTRRPSPRSGAATAMSPTT